MHPGEGIAKDAVVSCAMAHLDIIECTICGEPDVLEDRSVWVEIRDDAPLECVRDGMLVRIAGRLFVTPLAYVCGECARFWPETPMLRFVLEPQRAA